MLARLRGRLSVALLPPRPQFGSLGPVLVAQAVALSLVAHCHYAVRPPTRTEWIAAELLLGTLLWLAGRKVLSRIVARVREAKARWTVFSVGVGTALWWQGQANNTFWVLPQDVHPILEVVLFTAHATVAALVFASLLVVVAATDGPVPHREVLHNRVRNWPGIALFAAATAAFAGWYVAQERLVYFADGMYQWTLAADWSDRLARTPADAWRAFRVSVQHGGYTLLPGALPGLAMALLGDARAVFVGAVAALYLTATYAAAIGFVRRTTGDARFLGPLAAVFLFSMPLAWIPILQGYPDIGGVPLAVLSLWLTAGRPREELRWPHLFGTAAVLVTMILFRRWYSFWAVGLMATTLLDGALAAAVCLFARKPKEAWQAVRPGGVLAGLFPVILAAVAWPVMPGMVGANYAQMLSGYRSADPFAARLWITLQEIGVGYVLLSGVATAYLVVTGMARRPVLFLLGVTAVMVPLFYRMQDPNRHHQYLALPALLLPPLMAASRVLATLPRWLAVSVMAAVTMAGAINLLGAVDAGWDAVRKRFAPLTATYQYSPVVRSDLAEFQRLLDFVTTHTAQTSKGFAVLSSSEHLHASMFQSAARSLGTPFPAAAVQVPTQEVDHVHGFPVGLFRAELVIVADPPQVHLSPAEQQTIVLPARLLRDHEGLGRAFERLPERFTLQNGVTVTPYRRTRPLSADEFANFCEQLRQAHPDDPFVFRPPTWAGDLLAAP
ncbi:hypothetical protein [Limnoglobus roseus]|uniref:Glycosyltransferase RgtA/B/C/D-like domain-containing protein n=1 Tax=Limnoglobus roseus TaxID=2598579 RepID=A0A5C1A906_9BACT|nr:hypothetical protein [Limnoglobus roseus]QEL14282.1 hypothetical protein PX52LOC_01154 [Limnoglobus roseus]